MIDQPEPLDVLRADVEQIARRRWRDLGWWLRKWPGVQLVKLILGGVVGGGLVWIALPFFAAALATAVVTLTLGYGIYARKQLVDERTIRRWAFVQGKRMQQEALKRDLSLAEATLILVGNPRDREVMFRIPCTGIQRVRRGRSLRPGPCRSRVVGTAASDGEDAHASPGDLATCARRHSRQAPPRSTQERDLQARSRDPSTRDAGRDRVRPRRRRGHALLQGASRRGARSRPPRA